MPAFIQSAGAVLLGAFAVPVAGMAGIASTISLLLILFSSESRSLGLYLFFLTAVAICLIALKALQKIAKFPMQGEAAAKRWCAKLNAIFNGVP